MQDWQLFKDSRFSLQFRYPPNTPQGYSVDKSESQQDDALRVHFISRDSQELYFEVTKYSALLARIEYQQHKAELEKRFSELVITESKEISWKSLPAYEYSFEWSKGTRSVILFERNGATYRILYDPRSPLNNQMLSTFEWTD